MFADFFETLASVTHAALATGLLFAVALAGCASDKEPAGPHTTDSAVADSATDSSADSDSAVEELPVEEVPDACAGLTHADVQINEVLASNLNGIADAAGDNQDWIELVSRDADDVDLAGWRLENAAGDSWTLESLTLSQDEFLLIYASGQDTQGDPDAGGELHASFKLKADAAEVVLVAPDGCTVDEASPGRLYGDISFGRAFDDPGAWEYFLESTPDAENTTESRPGFAEPPLLSPDAGFTDGSVEFSVSSAEAGATFYITDDGSVPTEDDTLYTGSLSLDASSSTLVLRAISVVDGLWPSRPATATYFGDDSPVDAAMWTISLVMNPDDLWDEDTGIYAFGRDYEPGYPYFGANFWQRWEKSVHVQMWDETGALIVDQDAGIAIQGGYTRAFDQKSLRLYARSGYGPSSFQGHFFETEDTDEYESLSLQIGMDWCSTHILEPAMGAFFRDPEGQLWSGVDIGAWGPAQVWLNGEYWGYYNLRERPNDEYLHNHHGVDRDKLDRVELGWTHEPNWELEQGSWEAFDALNDFVIGRDLSVAADWEAFDAMVDLDSLAAAILVEGYSANTDWWYNNLRLWRPTTDDGQWRWVLFDFGHGWPSYSYDHFGVSVGWTGDGLPIADALENNAFRVRLANQAADYLNTSLSPDTALATLNAIADRVEPAMPGQFDRWCGGASTRWASDVDYARTFVTERPNILREQVRSHLGLGGPAELALSVDPADAGRFTLTAVTVDAPFVGTYYRDVPVTITAVPAEGYRFVGWSEASLGDSETVEVELTGDTSYTALFEVE